MFLFFIAFFLKIDIMLEIFYKQGALVRLLNPQLLNPYIEESPFFEVFEKLLSKKRKMHNNDLEQEYQKQVKIFNNDESDGLDLHNAEEITFAITIVKSERDPKYKDFITKEFEVESEIKCDIEGKNPYEKGTNLYNVFEKEVSLLTMSDMESLKTQLDKDIEKYNIYFKELKQIEKMKLIWDIQVTKTTISLVG